MQAHLAQGQMRDDARVTNDATLLPTDLPPLPQDTSRGRSRGRSQNRGRGTSRGRATGSGQVTNNDIGSVRGQGRRGRRGRASHQQLQDTRPQPQNVEENVQREHPTTPANTIQESELLAAEVRKGLLEVLNARTNQYITLTRNGEPFRSVQGMNVNGGHCKFYYEYDRLKRVPMNGDEVTRFLANAGVLAEYVYAGHSERELQARQDFGLCLATWKHVVTLLQKRVYRDGDKHEAQTKCAEFVEAWKTYMGPTTVTHYMHILGAHADWFFGTVDDPNNEDAVSWWTAQAHERAHGLRKRVFRYVCTTMQYI